MRVFAAIVALCAQALLILDWRHARVGDPRRMGRREAWIAFIVLVVAVGFLVASAATGHARPSPHGPATPFAGDRYAARQAQGASAADVVRAVRLRRGRAQRAPVVRRIALSEGMTREARRATGGRPRAWCGWWLGQHLGIPSRHLWLARNWAKEGSHAGGPGVGVVVVWAHHVGIITGRSARGWIVKSGNDGHAVRERARSVSGAIAFRHPPQRSS